MAVSGQWVASEKIGGDRAGFDAHLRRFPARCNGLASLTQAWGMDDEFAEESGWAGGLIAGAVTGLDLIDVVAFPECLVGFGCAQEDDPSALEADNVVEEFADLLDQMKF